MPLLVASIVLFFVRQLKPTTIALLAYRTWRRLPPEQRQQMIVVARRDGLRLAAALTKRGRPRA